MSLILKTKILSNWKTDDILSVNNSKFPLTRYCHKCNFHMPFAHAQKHNCLLAERDGPYWGLLARDRVSTDLAALGLYCHDRGPIFPSRARASEFSKVFIIWHCFFDKRCSSSDSRKLFNFLIFLTVSFHTAEKSVHISIIVFLFVFALFCWLIKSSMASWLWMMLVSVYSSKVPSSSG